MPSLDVNAAKAAGYSDDEIQQFVQQQGAALNLDTPRGVQHGGAYFADQSTPEYQEKYGPLSGQNDFEKVLAGAGRGLVHTGRSLGNFAGLVPDETMAEEKHLDAPLLADPSGRFGNLVGESAATAPIGMGAGAAVGKLAPALADSGILQGALQGGVQGFSTADPGERAAQTLAGALTGGTLSAAGTAGRKAIYGASRTPAAQTLIDQGVQLTPGQMNPSGAFNQFEQAAESIPGAKQIIEPARESAERQWQARVVQMGAHPDAPPIGSQGSISDMLQRASDSYDPFYAQAKGFPVGPKIMNTSGPDVPLKQAFAQKVPGVTTGAQQTENAWLQNELSRLKPDAQGNVDSADLLTLRSNIRTRARQFKLNTDSGSTDRAAVLDAAQQKVTGALQSQLPPEPLAVLARADSNYGNYKLIENAVAQSKDNLAGLTPQKLSQAIYSATPDASYARGGGGKLREMAQAGGDVFQNVSPPTGARVLTLGAGALGALHPYVGVPVATSMLGLTGTKTGRALAAGTTGPQQAAQKLIAALSARVPQTAQDVGGQYLARGATGALIPYGQQAAPAALAAALMLGKNAGGAPPAEGH